MRGNLLRKRIKNLSRRARNNFKNISSSLDVAKKYNNAQELVCANLLLIKSDHTV